MTYFWGGKSLVLGWDSRWGTPTTVTAPGSGSTGKVLPFGLDCSGFVDWTFYNATSGAYLPGRGGGAASQHGYCTNIKRYVCDRNSQRTHIARCSDQRWKAKLEIE